MKLLIEIPDNKSTAFMKVIDNLSYIKVIPLTDSKALLLKELKEAVEEMKLIKTGKKKARNAEDFLNEL